MSFTSGCMEFTMKFFVFIPVLQRVITLFAGKWTKSRGKIVHPVSIFRRQTAGRRFLFEKLENSKDRPRAEEEGQARMFIMNISQLVRIFFERFSRAKRATFYYTKWKSKTRFLHRHRF